LVLSNHYPSYDDLYRNGFVHTRVRAYREHGLDVDVFRLRPDQPISWHEFEGVDVTTGSKDALRRMLGSRRYERVAVHFLDTDMWEVLQECIDGLKVVVWVHGAEIHPWWRRKFNYRTDDEVARAKMQSEQRMAFWRGIFEPVYPNLHFVFVSQTFANEVMEDYHIALSLEQYSVIHNPINTDLFSFREKPAAQRKKVLAVRPYASRQYANDIAVNAIVELSKTADFEDLEFHLIGDGPLFEETVQPLRSFKNVRLDRRFATQNEIANLHKAYGVFLCPSRWDSQGVSRDEAMSSGLVPVTTRVAAIPEFVDEQSGVLAEPESPQSLAEGILSIVRDKERFKCLSTNAAMRVRSQSAAEKIVQQELQLLRPCQSED
jgi:glycosyltransferase involved in cell wall biosynthesis